MIRTHLAVAALLLIAATTEAALLVVPGIPSFDTSLGTLQSVTVTIDPDPMMTNDYDAGPFENIGNHNHIVAPFPVTVPGLDTFPFTPTPTNLVNPSVGASHNHVFNLPPSAKVFSGPNLAWFLDPANGVNTVNLVAPPTSTNDDHNHTINFSPVVPQTRFTFLPTQVPEPSAALLAMAGMGACFGRRRMIR